MKAVKFGKSEVSSPKKLFSSEAIYETSIAVAYPMKFLLLAASILAFGLQHLGPRNSNTHSETHTNSVKLPFYRITHAGSRDTSYLFGTLHLLESSYVDTLPRVMKALHRADIVIGELVMDSIMGDAGGLTSDALTGLFDAPPLDSLLSKSQYREVSEAVKKYSPVPMMMLNRAEPVIIYAMIFEGMYARQHPENQTTGIPMDLFFQQEASKHGTTVMGLEQASDQEQALDSIPIKEQTEELLDLARHPNTTMHEMDEMLTDYRAGRISEILDDPGFGSFSPEEMSSLLYNRNKKWLDTLPAILDHHNAFIAVGAGHLAGKQGLVEQLRKRGYDVAWVRTK